MLRPFQWLSALMTLASSCGGLLVITESTVFGQATPLNQAPGQKSAPALGQAVGQSRLASGQVELKHSHVYIRVDKTRVGHEHAVMGNLKSGQLNLKAAEDSTLPAGTLVFDMTSFEADTEAARKYIGMSGSIDADTRKAVNENMLGKAVLDVRKYPTATFEARQIRKLDRQSPEGLPQYEIRGNLTLHGTTRAVEFTVQVGEVKGWQHIRGAFSILQSNFGIKPYSKAFGVIGVADQLDIYGDLIVAP